MRVGTAVTIRTLLGGTCALVLASGCASHGSGHAAAPTGPSIPLSAVPVVTTAATSPAATASSALPLRVPEVFAAACGHPGAQVTVTDLPVTIPRALCDLTGVVVVYGETGVTIPASGGVQANADGTSGATDIGAFVDPSTGDVTLK